MSGYHGRNRPTQNGGPQGVQRSYASQLKEHDSLFSTYEHLQGLERGDTALTMLRKVASLVKPIMRKRGWKVQILAEFLPAEHNLLGLNINRGYKICIRLRYHNNPGLFLPLEQVVDTMLHELSHNVWGEHDARFHRLWDELRDEWETLTRKGYTGEGFLSKGQKLGGGRLPPPSEMRRLARASAEKRKSQAQMGNGSGQRLGGTPLHAYGGDVRSIIADQITRRNTIDKGCASGRKDAIRISDQASNNTFKTKADEDDANNRAIAQALYELMEEEEGRKLDGTFSTAPTDGGLAWDPEDGLYDPRREKLPELSGGHEGPPSEQEQMEWALQESMRSTSSTPDSESTPPHAGPSNIPRNFSRVNSAPPTPTQSKASPVSAMSETRPAFHPNGSPISPVTPEGEVRSPPKRKRHLTESSLSNSIIVEDIEPPEPSTHTAPETSPVIDISEPFDPNAKPPDEWTCEICTCINPLQFLACDACGCERPQGIGLGNRGARPPLRSTVSAPAPASNYHDSLGWICTNCSSFMEHRWWTCSACGKMKDSS